MRKLFYCILALVVQLPAYGQIVLQNTLTPEQLVQQVLLGSGVSVSNITFNGLPGNTITEQMGEFDATNAQLAMALGVIMATGDIDNAMGPNNLGSNSLGGGNFGQTDPDLGILASPQLVNDAALLEFDFIPNGDTLKFDFIFASDEYPEYVCGVNVCVRVLHQRTGL